MNDKLKEKMLDKVRKLLALATSANENEAAAAAEKAQVILAEHNLNISDIQLDKNEKEEEVGVFEACETITKPWRRPLANAVGAMFLCKYFFVTYGKSEKHHFVGTEANALVAIMMFKYLNSTIERLAAEAALEYAKGNERGRFRLSFKNACAERLTQRIGLKIWEAKKGQLKTTSEDGVIRNLPALVDMYEKAKLKNEAHIEQNIGALKTKDLTLNARHATAAAMGRAAGDKIGLDQQIKSDKADKALPNHSPTIE